MSLCFYTGHMFIHGPNSRLVFLESSQTLIRGSSGLFSKNYFLKAFQIFFKTQWPLYSILKILNCHKMNSKEQSHMIARDHGPWAVELVSLVGLLDKSYELVECGKLNELIVIFFLCACICDYFDQKQPLNTKLIDLA